MSNHEPPLPLHLTPSIAMLASDLVPGQLFLHREKLCISLNASLEILSGKVGERAYTSNGVYAMVGEGKLREMEFDNQKVIPVHIGAYGEIVLG